MVLRLIRKYALPWDKRFRATPSLCCAAALVFGGVQAFGEDLDEPDTDTQIRVRYQYQQRVKEKIRAFGMLRYDEQLGSDAVLGEWNRLASTGGVSYDLSPRVRLEGALGLYYTWRPSRMIIDW